MKKLFLTSGLVLSMTCPAFATDITYGGDPAAYGSYACTYPYLESYESSASLEAIWDANPYTITLNSNTGSGAANYGSTAASPSSLYAIFGDAVYLESAHTNAMSTSANGLTTTPTGKTYTLTLDPNLPTGHTTSEISGSTGYAASTNAQMQFQGFYSAAQSAGNTTNGTQYIGSNGKITQDGITAGTTTSSNSTWYAQYTCQNASTYTPVLAGYTFNGWYTATSGGSVDSNLCLTANKTVHAQWSPKTATITFDNKRYTSASDPTGTSTGITTAGTSSVVTRYENGVYANATTAAAMTPTISTITAPAMTGYIFGGYWTGKTGTGTQYVATTGGTLMNNLDQWKNGETGNTTGTLYAKWTAKTYDVTYAVGTCGGTNKTYSGGLTYNQNYEVLGTSASGMTVTVPSGYTFNGWTESLTGNATRQPGYVYQPWNTDGGLTLTAQCSANNINITFNCAKPTAGTAIPGGSGAYAVTASETVSINLGTGDVAVQNSTTSATHAIAMDGSGTITTTCSLNGWTFDGWSCTSGLTSDSAGSTAVSFISIASIDNGTSSVYMKNSNGVTCTAKWTQNHINLTWKDGIGANGGSAITVGTASQSCDYDGAITLPTPPNRDGYTFSGWTVSN